jgi:hypothetical protein
VCFQSSNHIGVIPAEAEGREPESITPGLWLWVPGSPLRGARNDAMVHVIGLMESVVYIN